jgi:ABC-2 type transport system permease protein
MSVATKPASRVPAVHGTRAPAWPETLRAVVRRGLRDRARAVVIWGLSIGVYGGFMAAIYPSMQTSIEKMLRSYPAGLKEAFGARAMNTIEGTFTPRCSA